MRRRLQNRQVKRNFSVDDFKIRYLSIFHSISLFRTLSHNSIWNVKNKHIFSTLNFCSSPQSWSIIRYLCIVCTANQIQTDMHLNDSSRFQIVCLSHKYIGFFFRCQSINNFGLKRKRDHCHCATLVRVHVKIVYFLFLFLLCHRSFSLFSLSFYFHRREPEYFFQRLHANKTLYKYDYNSKC